MTGDYDKFRKAFAEGQVAIRQAAEGVLPEQRHDDDAVHKLVNQEWDRLSATEFAVAMLRDSDLENLRRALEHGMSTWIGAWTAETDHAPSPEEAERLQRWAGAECFVDERRLAFWGRLGGILYHYRDRGRSLPNHFERSQRGAICAHAAKLRDAMEVLVADPLVSTMYKTATLATLDRMSKACAVLDTELATSTLEVEVGPNPFHDSDGLIRSQFSTAFGLMAVELYGHVTPAAMGAALEIKSSTAELLGLVPWGFKVTPKAPADGPREPMPQESQDAILRDLARTILRRAIPLGERRGWVTLPLVRYYAAQSTRRRELDGDERRRHKCATLPQMSHDLDLLFGADRTRTPHP